jgi:uncharacterized Zn-finger protein
MKHIKKDKSYLCPICQKQFTHTHNVKEHIKLKHSSQDLQMSKVPVNQLFHERAPMPNKNVDKKDLYYLREDQNLKRQLDINDQTWKAVCSLSILAPVLKLQAIDGAQQSPITALPV